MLKTNLQFRHYLQKELRKQQNQQGFRLLGIDYGTKFIGLSITDTSLKDTYMLETIQSKGDLKTYNNPIVINKIKNHILKENVKGFVLGATNFHRFFDSEMNSLISKIDPNMPYTTVDETYTTYASKQILDELSYNFKSQPNLKSHKDLGDGISSMLIMQIFLDYYNNQSK